MSSDQTAPRVILRELLNAALLAASPEHLLAKHLPAPPKGRCLVLGAGKAAASMAQALEQAWTGDRPPEGLVVTRYGHGVPTQHIEVVEAAHPVPDAAGQRGAERMLALATDAREDDLVVCLISGGASALLSLPAPGATLQEKQDLNTKLLRSGAPIDEMNLIRKRLSAIKGGRLARAIAPAQALTLLISDVPGDEPAVIGSGPTTPDTSTYEQAQELLDRYAITLPKHLHAVMRSNTSIDTLPDNQRVELIATPQKSLEAAALRAREFGITPVILGDAIEGEAREVARVHAGIARQVATHGQPQHAPCVLLSGGETTVTVKGEGRGGRNAEFALALALALAERDGVYAIACDTDGIDGSEDNAGAIVMPNTLERLDALGLDARAALEGNDAYPVFAALDDLVMTGPTLTNVNDFRAIYIEPGER